ncbi:beta-ketoacyl-ACP synthase [Methylobacterium oryzae]|uniref:beta-ketoacyl-ACP synthase n=1 Tax=Methylobacterium oryzae TaxID=334852 RepID=UPI002F2DEDB6
MSRPVVVTGLGLVSCAGEGVDAHLAALAGETAPRTDSETFAPYPVHPAPAIAWDGQIPKRSDQRQMEAWQRLGVYAAGLALDEAGVKDDAALKQALHLVVAAGGGERDYAADGAILTGLRDAADPGAYLNERLQNDLRPTLFLAQLSNLLAGNIAIVHGVTGASRTFMGEESAGVDALRIAQARVASGQIDAILVGGSYSAERPDVLVIHEMGGYLARDAYRPVFARGDAGGFILGSCAAFLMLESDRRVGQMRVNTPGLDAGAVDEARMVGPRPGRVQEDLGQDLVADQVGPVVEVAVTAVGHRRGEGVLRLVPA